MGSATAARYERALRDLSEGVAQAEGLARLLDHFAGLLRGGPPDPEGPPLELYPSVGQVRRALQRRAGALDAARDAWGALPAEVQDGRPSPEDALDGVENSRG
jgi:hypothetical protein